MGEDVPKYLFYKSAVIACDAATLLIKRYADVCYDKARTAGTEARRKELEKWETALCGFSENPARTFWEAVQATMLYQSAHYNRYENTVSALGRFDQYTWPFLKKDLEEGTITMDEAQEIVDAFFLKANCYYDAGPPSLSTPPE